MMSVKPILTISINPALDVTTSIGQIKPEGKLRCATPRFDAGGGGVNVSRAIGKLGGDSHAFVAIAGSTGEWFQRLLNESGVDNEIWEMQGETRFALTVMEEATGEQYRFNLPGPQQTVEEAERLLGVLCEQIGAGYQYVIASGSLPPGVPVDFYARLTKKAREIGVSLILDTSGPPLKAAFVEKPYLMKLDRFEAAELVEDGMDARALAPELAQKLVDQHAAEIVIITLGDNGACIASASDLLLIRPPKVKVLSAVGAGDSFLAALTIGLVNNWSLEDASRFGVAAATSAVTTEATELCERSATQRYFDETARYVKRIDRTI